MEIDWQQPECIVSEIEDSDVHVWATTVDQANEVLQEFEHVLSSDELVRRDRFRDEHAARQFVVARGVLRELLAIYLNDEPQRIEFEYGRRGKPVLAGKWSGQLSFNLSHSGQLIVFAFARDRQIGVDLEQKLPLDDADAIAEQFFAPDEAELIAQAQHQKADVFYTYWTRKEALLKCSGRGIDDEALCRTEAFDGSVYELRPAEGYVGAVAATGNPFNLRTWRWGVSLKPNTNVVPVHIEATMGQRLSLRS